MVRWASWQFRKFAGATKALTFVFGSGATRIRKDAYAGCSVGKRKQTLVQG